MSLDEEIAVVHRLVQFEDGEELLGVVEGDVSVIPDRGFGRRDGILFLTNRRVGVSAAGSFLILSKDAAWWRMKFTKVRALKLSGAVLEVYDLDGDTLQVEAYDDPEDLREARKIVLDGMATFLRADLENDFHRAIEDRDAGRISAAEALAKFDALQELQERSLDVRMERIWTLHNLGRWDEALEEARFAVEIGGFDRERWRFQLASLALQQGEHEEAERVATEMYEAEPWVQALLIRARSRHRRGDLPGAFLDAEKATSTAPDEPDAWHFLAELGAERGDAVVLQRCVERLQGLGQDELVSVFEGALLLARGDAEAAYAAAADAREAGVDDPIIATTMVMAAVELESPLVLEKLDSLDGIAEASPIYQAGAVTALLQHRRTAKALARFEALELPDGPAFAALRGVVVAAHRIGRGEWDAARGALERVVEPVAPDWLQTESLQSRWTDCCGLAGWAELKAGNTARAAELLLRAEAGTRSELPWLREALPGLVERATARASLPGPEASVGPMTTYEVLSRLDGAVRKSTHLGELSERVQRLLDDFDEAPLIAVMGEYSVGKSSFINALVKRPLLPTGEGVTTGTITVLRHGTPERMRAVFPDGRVVEREGLTSVEDFVKETGRGKRASDLPHHVDVFLESDVLRTTTVVDTPGLNAPFPEHRKITENYLAEADAVVWLFNVETAGRSTEREFLNKLHEHRRKAVGVVNQIDLVPMDELEDVMECVAEAFPNTFASLHPVSAKRALNGLLEGDTELARRSGMPKLLGWLEENILAEARPIKEAATREKVRATLDDVRALRETFDAMAADQLAQVRSSRDGIRKWIDGELANDLAETLDQMRQELEEAIYQLAVAVVEQRGQEQDRDGPPEQTDFARWGRELVSDARGTWALAVQRTLGRYDDRMESIEPMLDGLSAPQWQGLLDASRRALRLSFESWRKDLEDYSEQLDAYADGFVDGGGLFLAYHCMPSSDHRSVESVRLALRASLTFLWERAQVAFSRWTGELRTNTVEELSRLEREMGAEVARVRETSFREVERLGLRLDAVPHGAEPIGATPHPAPGSRPGSTSSTNVVKRPNKMTLLAEKMKLRLKPILNYRVNRRPADGADE